MEANRTPAKALRRDSVAVLEPRPTLERPTPAADGHRDRALERNPGTPLDLDVVRAQRVNRSAVERRAAPIPTRRTV